MKIKGAWIVAGIVAAIIGYIIYFEPETWHGLIRVGGKFLALGFGVLMCIGAFVNFYFYGIKGEQDTSSAPVENPQSMGNRAAAMGLGTMLLLFGVPSLLYFFGLL